MSYDYVTPVPASEVLCKLLQITLKQNLDNGDTFVCPENLNTPNSLILCVTDLLSTLTSAFSLTYIIPGIYINYIIIIITYCLL